MAPPARHHRRRLLHRRALLVRVERVPAEHALDRAHPLRLTDGLRPLGHLPAILELSRRRLSHVVCPFSPSPPPPEIR